MEKTIGEVFLLFRPLGFKERDVLQQVQEVLSPEQYRDIILLLKQKKLTARLLPLFQSSHIIPQTEKCAVFEALCADPDVSELMTDVNQQIQKHFFKTQWKQFARDAPLKIPKLLVPSVLCFDLLKRAIALQLFAAEPVHILFVGEPAVGKSSILHNVAALHPSSSYCSATTLQGNGLLATALGDEIESGPLPVADNGILCLDDVHSLSPDDAHFLVQAMEKGVVFYTKAEQHCRFDAHVRVLATTSALATLPLQLLSQFHFIFSLKKPQSPLLLKEEKSGMEDKKPLLEPIDHEFLKSYICHAEQLQVQFPEIYQEQLASFVSVLQKKHSSNTSQQNTPSSSQVLLGMKRLAQARARMCLREKVIQEDVTEVKTIVERTW